MAAHRSGGFDELSDEAIRNLVDSLNSLKEGELGVSMLVACGPRAVPPLRDFLLEGRRSGIFEPRCRAVRALADLGAYDVLVEYLGSLHKIADPIVRFGEEAVENAAARAVANWPTDQVFQVLLSIVSERPLSGAIESLAGLHRPEAIPHMIRALEDDVARRSAEDALREFGGDAYWALIDAALTPVPSPSEESPSSKKRRRAALKLLEAMEIPADAAPAIRVLFREEDDEIASSAARIMVRIGSQAETMEAIRRIIDSLRTTDWLVRMESEDFLAEHFAEYRPVIESELNQLRRPDDPVQARLKAIKHRCVARSASENMQSDR
jgi:HEAT repeat protein